MSCGCYSLKGECSRLKSMRKSCQHISHPSGLGMRVAGDSRGKQARRLGPTLENSNPPEIDLEPATRKRWGGCAVSPRSKGSGTHTQAQCHNGKIHSRANQQRDTRLDGWEAKTTSHIRSSPPGAFCLSRGTWVNSSDTRRKAREAGTPLWGSVSCPLGSFSHCWLARSFLNQQAALYLFWFPPLHESGPFQGRAIMNLIHSLDQFVQLLELQGKPHFLQVILQTQIVCAMRYEKKKGKGKEKSCSRYLKFDFLIWLFKMYALKNKLWRNEAALCLHQVRSLHLCVLISLRLQFGLWLKRKIIWMYNNAEQDSLALSVTYCQALELLESYGWDVQCGEVTENCIELVLMGERVLTGRTGRAVRGSWSPGLMSCTAHFCQAGPLPGLHSWGEGRERKWFVSDVWRVYREL